MFMCFPYVKNYRAEKLFGFRDFFDEKFMHDCIAATYPKSDQHFLNKIYIL